MSGRLTAIGTLERFKKILLFHGVLGKREDVYRDDVNALSQADFLDIIPLFFGLLLH